MSHLDLTALKLSNHEEARTALEGLVGSDRHSSTVLVRQRFRYEYSGPVRALEQRLVVVPPERHGAQRLIAHQVEPSISPSMTRRSTDRFGNQVIEFHIDDISSAIDFDIWIVVEHGLVQSPNVVDHTRLNLEAFRAFTPLTRLDSNLLALARTAQRSGNSPEEITRVACHLVHQSMNYMPGATDIETTAAAAFRSRSGVCQDYAHIMLALCRHCGIPARYVSGHLVGEGGSHAWVEALIQDRDDPSTVRAVPLDPTHDTEPGLDYVTVAVGRDFADVSPTSGTYRSSHRGTLLAEKQAVVARSGQGG